MKSKMKGITLNCSAGFGFTGKCYSAASILKSLNLPSDINAILSASVIPIINKVTGNITACIGDFPGTSIEAGSDGLSALTCKSIPLDQSTGLKYGVIGGTIGNVPCGTPQTVEMCVTFTQCGTFAISINGGLLECLATYSTGIAAVAGPFAKLVDHINLGFSLERKFAHTYSLAYSKDGTTLTYGQVTSKGHFYFGFGMDVPFDKIKIGSTTLDKYVKLSVDVDVMIDLGNIPGDVKGMISSITSANKTTKNFSSSSILSKIQNLGAEFTINIDGTLTLQLESLTSGWLPDLPIEIEGNFLITTGGGASTLTTGLYLYLDVKVSLSLKSLIQGVLNHMGPIIKAVGVLIPNISLDIDLTLGVFIQSNCIGFEFTFENFNFMCIYKYGSNGKAGTGSCHVNGGFFTAIAQGAQWVISEAKNLFDATGKVLAKVDQGVGKMLSQAEKSVETLAKNVVSTVTKDVAVVATAAKQVAKTVVSDIRSVAKKILSWL